MRKKTVLIAAILFFLPILISADYMGAPKGERRIQTCILNDMYHPVEQKIINKIVDKVFKEYREEVKVEFLRYEFLQFDYDIKKPSEEILIYAKKRCSGAPEIRIVFSSFERKDIEIEKDIYGKNSVDIYIIHGAALGDDGLVIIYNTAIRFTSYDAGGNESAVTTLKHEIGHLFTLKHTRDARSFMYKEGSDYSLGRWTQEIREGINRNKNKTWY